jgi:acyl carrier protein
MTTDDKLKAVFSALLGVDASRIDHDSSPSTIGAWDSIKHIDLILEIEDQFGVSFEATEVFGLNSYRNILQLLEEKLADA